MATEKLQEFQEYGKFILDKIVKVGRQPDQTDWVPSRLRPCIDRLQKAAQKTVDRASSPVKIGVMGEFSSGKTLLLGSLLGYADALPVSENPTTGNVTAIHLVQQEGYQTTKIEKFEVTYLDRQGVIDCLTFMLKEAERRGRAAGLSSAASLQGINPQDAGAGREILRWCEEAWNQTKNPDLRYLLRELVLFVRANSAYSGALGGKTQAIDPEVARVGLDLGAPAMNIQTMDFNELPPEPEQLQNSPQSLTALLLQNSFPLIRRVDVTVKVSKEIWDLSALKTTNEFVLLDFPGLGAANSGVRDTFLSLRELAEVQTILILLNGSSPGRGTANEIFTLMEQQRPGEDLKDRILVGVGRFDLLPLTFDGGERVLDELIGDRAPFEEVEPQVAEPLDRATVLEKIPVLNNIMADVGGLTDKPENVLLLSPMLALADLDRESPRDVAVGSQDFLAKLQYPDFLDTSLRLQKKWERLSVRLQKSGSGGTLGKQLDYFAQDGGIRKLRSAIAEHVKTHGIKQLEDDVRKAARETQQEQQVLQNILQEIEEGGILTEESKDFTNLRDNIEGLIDFYTDFKKDIGKEHLSYRGVPVWEAVKNELAFRIFNWDRWNALFQQTKEGIVELPQYSDSDEDDLGDIMSKLGLGEQKANDNRIPTRSDDFYDIFAQTLLEVEKYARDLIRQSVEKLLTDLSYKVQGQRKAIADKLAENSPGDNIQRQQAIDDLKNFVSNVAKPEEWLHDKTEGKTKTDGILKECGLEENGSATSGDQTASVIETSLEKNIFSIEPESAFPLARKDTNHQNSGQVFAWAPDQSKANQQPVDHQVLVLRMRDEMIASAGNHLVQFVSKKEKKVNDVLTEKLTKNITKVTQMKQAEALLRFIAEGGDSGSDSRIPHWLRNLSQIASKRVDF